MEKNLENTFHKLAYREITIAKFEITGFLYHFFKDRERIVLISKRSVYGYDLDHFNFCVFIVMKFLNVL